MKAYLDILEKIMTSEYSVRKETRTGVATRSLSGVQFEHDMRNGFPLLTTKKMGIKSISAELEFFIKGLSDKRWLQERGCTIWNKWCNPKKVPYAIDAYSISEMAKCNDLGRIYGVQWRNWKTNKYIIRDEMITDNFKSFDQLKDVIDRAKKNPLDRRLLVTAWRPDELDEMALPPCHYAWQILSDGTYLDLIWIQRSCDFGIGIPYNIASYAILLLLLSKELNLIPRRLVGQLGDTHIYENHFDGLKIQASREPYPLPTVIIPDENWNGILEWKYTDIILENYQYYPKINLPIAV